MSPRTALLFFVPLLASCASVPGPRFGQTVAASFARSPMRKLTTPELEVYYPEGSADAAHAMAARMGDCLTRLRAKATTQRPRGRALVYLTDSNFNNAYMTGQVGGEPLQTVTPLFATNEGFHLDGFGTAAIADIGCHELLHYVHYEQVEGFWRLVNAVFGDLVPPQAYLERWFTEGLAQYYEGRLGHDSGRPHSPLYRAELEAGLAARGGWVGPGDLTVSQRELIPSSGAYLAGLHFIEYLARTYGEEKLWELIDLQGRSFFIPFGVALRFKAVYGRSLGALIDDWSLESQATVRDRPSPANQRVLVEALGYAARLATAADGTIAVVSAGRDEVVKLKLFEADGRLRAENKLARFVPPRQWTGAGPGSTSGMSFTADSRWLYLMNDDASELGDARTQLWRVDARTAEVTKVWQDVGGLGGSIHPAGGQYLFVDVTPGRSELVAFDLATSEKTPITTGGAGVTYGAPAWSPDGARIAYSKLGPRGWDVWLREADGAAHALTDDGAFNYGPRWIDGGHLLFLRTRDGRPQAHVIDLSSGMISAVTDARFSAFDAAPLPGGQLAFLNRDGWNWSLAAAPLLAVGQVERAAVAPPEPAPAPAPPLTVESDGPYRPGEGLGVPLLRLPAIAALSPVCNAAGCYLDTTWTLALAGRDRLSFHNWGLSVVFATPSLDLSVYGSYDNQTLAPWLVSASAGYDRRTFVDPLKGPVLNEIASANVAVGRAFFDTPVGLSFGGFQQWDPVKGDARFVGPSVGFDYFASEATVYAGLTRALGVRGQLAIYPGGLSTYPVTDLSLGFTGALPLPVLKRHSFTFGVDVRSIFGAPDGALQVGGVARGTDLLSVNRTASGEDAPDVPMPATFAIGVRGYEDYGIRANKAGVGVARYRYPVIIDRGFASIFYVLPSLFFRQVDADLFGSAAITDAPLHPWLRAVGASVSLRLLLGGALPLSIYYRWAWRLDERLKALHSIGFSFE